MLNEPFVRDIVILLVATLVGVVGGSLTVHCSSSDAPAWPLRLYLAAFRHSSVPRLRQYAASRTVVTKREQLLVACFVWFFIAFGVGAVFFGCSYRLGCH